MIEMTPFQFLGEIFHDPLGHGQILVWSKIRRNGRTLADWCFSLHHAALKIERWRNNREIFFGVALHDRQIVLRRARQRDQRASLARERGTAESATALPALWAETAVAAEDPLRGSRSALARIESMSPPPSLLVWTGAAYQAYWRLAETWVLKSDDDRRRAMRLLGKLGWALASAAAVEGRLPDAGGDLAGLMRVAGTFHQPRGTQGVVPVVVAGRPGRDLWTAGDFECLEDPPELARGGSPAAGEGAEDRGEDPPQDAAPPPAVAGPETRAPRSAEDPDPGSAEAVQSPYVRARRSRGPEAMQTGEGLEIQVVLRAAPGTALPASWSPLVEAATACLEDGGSAGPPAADPAAVSPRFLDGLEELVAALGGAATAGEMVDALRAEKNRARFGRLRSALLQLFPQAEDGLPTARQLGYVLRSHRRTAAGEKAAVTVGESRQGMTWTVRETEAP